MIRQMYEVPIPIAKLPPLKSREISPRYNLAFKLSKEMHEVKRGMLENKKHHESNVISNFLNHKLQKEGGLYFDMPNLHLDMSNGPLLRGTAF